ncbi:L-2-amino-thiazoline-4-carboxylic acid hydrolase [Vallitalea guaymasensis]|uniref:L-2-amino-thiazoline-4-carboxylic acid hydrolase n=1 Tax=Vallitalea guaymasensis TaxID=1185412 RepID=UPI002729C7F7|nr:L-2-amino-thiazoline-4-carboxylic acid hydrolase [Vallitalea guaymasensis]
MNAFLVEKFGEDKGNHLFSLQQARLEELLNKTRGKTEKQMKTLRNTIMPRIALYQILQESGIEQQKSYDIVKEYMVDVVCARMKKQFRRMEKIPFFYKIFKKNIINNLLKGGNWESELIHDDSKSFTAHVHKCLWYDATVENGCPELCRAFCECDDINFDVFKKIDFYREGALGMGADKCDFTFKKAK